MMPQRTRRKKWTDDFTAYAEGVRRRRLTVFGGIGVAQLIAWTVILALYYHAPCDRPLALYLLLTTVRIAISFPRESDPWTSLEPRLAS